MGQASGDGAQAAVGAMKPRTGLDEHQNAFAVNALNAVFGAVLYGGRGFSALLQP